MTTAPCHVIRTHALRLDVARAGSAQALLALATELARTRLAEEADAAFNRHGPARGRVRLDRVELDLGTIAEQRFAADFPVRFREALETELRRRLRAMGDGDGGDGWAGSPGGDDIAARLAVIGHLLQRGTMPWWSPADAAPDPAVEFMALLAVAPREVAAALRRIGRARGVRFRLVRWLADPQIAVVIRTLAPADADFILAYAADLDARQHEEPLVPAPAAEFRHAKWEIILGHLLADAGSRFNAKAFLRQTIRALAGRFHLDYPSLLAGLAACARAAAFTWRDASLPALLIEIHAEDVQRAAEAEATVPPAERAVLARWGQVLAQAAPPPPEAAGTLAFWLILPRHQALDVAHRLVERHGAAALRRILSVLPAAERAALRELLPEARPAPGAAVTPLVQLAAALDEDADHRTDDLAALRTLLETGLLPRQVAFTRWHQRPDDWLLVTFARHPAAAAVAVRAWISARARAAAAPHRLPPGAPEILRELLLAAGDHEALRHLARVVPAASAASAAVAAGTATMTPAAPEAGGGHCPPAAVGPPAGGRLAGGSAAAAIVELAALSPLVRLRLLQLLLVASPATRLRALLPPAAGTGRGRQEGDALAFPVLDALDIGGWWAVLAEFFCSPPGGARPADPWPSLVRAQVLAPEAGRAVEAGNPRERLLQAALFEGEPAQAEAWRQAIAWLEGSPRAAGLVPGGQAGLRTRLWAVLAELVRESGGHPVRDAMAFLLRALVRLGAVRGAGGPAVAREDAAAARLREALAGDGSRAAQFLASQLAASTTRRGRAPAAVPPRPPPRRGEDEAGARGPGEAGEPAWVDNAGLVLLAPFFERLFARCGLLDGGEFAGFEAAQRAVHLLQFLVTGDAGRVHEFSLALNKVLCGFDAETPVVPQVELAPEECAAAEGLLEFAAGQWPRGASVSAGGLRHSYLRRPGRLERGDETWSLQVEKRGWDVLLPELPWTFPGPKPGWMPLALDVDWI